MRFGLLPIGAVVLITGVAHAGAPSPGAAANGVADPWAEESEGEAPAAAKASEPVAADAPEGAPRKRSKRVAHSRRRGPKPVGWVVPETKLRATPLPAPSGNLVLYNLSNREEVNVNIYNPDGSYNVDALKAVSHIMRCKRTDAERDIEPRLMTVLSHVYDHYGKRLELVSGFRNQRRTTSFHYHASASDIRIPGVEPKKLRNFVDTLDAGGMGVGLYPRSRFVHVDIRPLPSYRWIDYSKSDPDNPDKRPPRGWKRKKRVS